jgi:2-oxoisovalerate dehydrogenase E1 component
VLFLVQDNKLAISTSTTGKTFYQTPAGDASEFYGIPIRRINGRYPQACLETFETVVAAMRKDRSPAIVVMDVEPTT